MCQDNASFRHHLDQVPGTQLETQIPPDAEDNDFLIEMSSFEQIISARRMRIHRLWQGNDVFSVLHQNPMIYVRTTNSKHQHGQSTDGARDTLAGLFLRRFVVEEIEYVRGKFASRACPIRLRNTSPSSLPMAGHSSQCSDRCSA